ncbi:hypothetical protein EDC04DRAFT_3095580 [Pisolithus marmoratus]|nr:hypothetical protein EDC04DRAFT_3095580 [Pisolithus marmoratus]
MRHHYLLLSSLALYLATVVVPLTLLEHIAHSNVTVSLFSLSRRCSREADGFLIARDISVSLSVIQISLLYYDYALTFGKEVELFWKRPRRSWPFVLFITNRYLTVLGHIPSSIYLFWSPSVDSNYSRCNPLLLYDAASIIVVQTIGAIVMIMRVYALYERSRCVLAMLAFLAVAGIVIAIWAVSSLPSSALVAVTQGRQIGCPGQGFLSSDQALYLSAGWGGQLLFDVVVFTLTLWRSMYLRTSGRGNISDVLLRDGSVYFAVMSAANIGNIITLLVARNNVKNVAVSFINIISATMISRLMLNLRDPSIVGPTPASFPPLSHLSAFATKQGLPGVETMVLA